MGILVWLLGSSIGRKVAIYGTITLAILLGIWRIFAAGQAKERAKQRAASIKALNQRIKLDEEISALPADKRLERLNRWVRDDSAG